MERIPVYEAPKKEKLSALDARWFPAFEQVANFQAYEYFEGEAAQRTETKEAFLRGDQRNPALEYPRLSEETWVTKEAELLALKETITAEEENSVVKQVYVWKLNEKIAETRLLLAAARGNMRAFDRYSRFVYGTPKPEIAQLSFNEAQQTVERGMNSEDARIQALAQELRADLPPTKEVNFVLPDEDDKQLVKEQTMSEFSDLVAIPEKANGEKFTAEEMQGIFGDALKQVAADDWVSIITKKSSTGVNTSQEKKEIQIPATREVLSKKLKGLLVHEVGTHVKRRVNGERTKLQILSLGLDRYEKGEEGVTTLREGVMTGKLDDFAGMDSHFPMALATGVDGTPRDFRDTFTLVKKYYQLKNLLTGKYSEEEAAAKADASAWTRCVRTFRGTDAATPGVCFTKDLIYREGNMAVWETVSKKIPGTDTPEMTRWSIGKYDPSNERHIWVLSELNITNEDLEALEKESPV